MEEVADQRDALRGVDDEHDRLTKAMSEAHAEEERLRAGLRALLSLVGPTTSPRRSSAGRSATTTRSFAMSPHGRPTCSPAWKRLTRGLEYRAPIYVDGENPDDFQPVVTRVNGQATSSEEWNAVLRRVIRRVVVDGQTITIEPWRGRPVIYDRAVVAPRRPRGVDPTPRGADGRFTGRA